jgi:carbon-monoxide dehydrogenase large subunit
MDKPKAAAWLLNTVWRATRERCEQIQIGNTDTAPYGMGSRGARGGTAAGTVLNPLIVRGQQQGAVAMGISGALLEEVDYDENGQNRSGSFADYLLATAVEIPPVEVISQPTPNRKTPTGSKGMSEGGIMGATGVLPSAVNDALAPLGVVVEAQPLSPMYIRALLRGKAVRDASIG